MASIAQLVLAAIAAVALLASSSVAQAPAYCGWGPFNLTTLQNGPDLFLDQSAVNGPSWALHPCGVVAASGFCSSATTPASFCQGTNLVAVFNASAVGDPNSDYVSFGVDNEPIWTIVLRAGQYGVAQIVQDGLGCGGYGARQGSMEFMCNPSATTPYISQVFESQTCHYSAVIQTSVVCSVSLSDALATGLPVQSTQCGGGFYDLSAVSVDIVDTADGVIIHPCGSIQTGPNSYCPSNSLTVCQSGSNNSLATYAPYNYPTLYQPITGGVMQIIQDGATCGAEERLVNITYLCDSSAATPVITVGPESPTCHYHFTITSSALCGQTASTPVLSVGATTCSFGPFDLTSISNQTLQLGTNYNGGSFYNWAIKPCGIVTDLGYCNGQFCQDGTVINFYNDSTYLSSSYQTSTGSDSTPLWAAATYQGQTGVAQIIQDGTSCGGNVGARQGAVYFLCNQTATTPYFQSVTENPSCHYIAVVQTAAVCGVSTTALQAVGVSQLSTQCGGGIYDLSGLTGDITGLNLNGNNWTVNLCSVQTSVPTTTGCNATSICQFTGDAAAPSGANGLTTYLPNLYPTLWTYNGNGVSQIIQDGPANCYGTNTERYTNVTLTCDSTALTPVMTQVTETVECHYTLYISTSAVCGTAFAGAAPGGGSSSSGSVSAGSSVSAASAASSSSASSAASAASAASSSSASSAASAASSSSAASTASAASSSSAATSAAAASSSSSAATSAPVVLSSSPSSTATVSVTSSSSSTAVIVTPSSSTATIVTPSSSSTAAPFVTSATSSSPVTTPTAVTSTTSTVAPSSSVIVVLPSSSTGSTTPPTNVNGASTVRLSNAALVFAAALAVAALLL